MRNNLFTSEVNQIVLTSAAAILLNAAILKQSLKNFQNSENEKAKIPLLLGSLLFAASILLKILLDFKSVISESLWNFLLIFQFILPFQIYFTNLSKSKVSAKMTVFLLFSPFIMSIIFFAFSDFFPLTYDLNTLWSSYFPILGLIGLCVIVPLRMVLKSNLKSIDSNYSKLLSMQTLLLFFTIISIITLFNHRTSYEPLLGILFLLEIIFIDFYFTSTIIVEKVEEQKSRLYLKDDLILKRDNRFNDLLNRLNKYISDHKPYLNPDITINEFARELYTNKSYLSRVVNQSYNTNFNQFLNIHRIEETKRVYYENPNISMEDLCLKSGFGSMAAFSIASRLYLGNSPSEWCRIEKVKIKNG